MAAGTNVGKVGTEFEQLVGRLLRVDGESGTSFLVFIVLYDMANMFFSEDLHVFVFVNMFIVISHFRQLCFWSGFISFPRLSSVEASHVVLQQGSPVHSSYHTALAGLTN